MLHVYMCIRDRENMGSYLNMFGFDYLESFSGVIGFVEPSPNRVHRHPSLSLELCHQHFRDSGFCFFKNFFRSKLLLFGIGLLLHACSLRCSEALSGAFLPRGHHE